MPGPTEATFSSVNFPEAGRPQPSATIEVGTVGLEDAAGMYTDLPNPFNFFTDTVINQRYEQDRHVYMMPLCSPTGFNGQSCSFVQLAAPTTLRIVDGTIARLNEPPTVPSPESINENWILLDAHAEDPVLTVHVDGVTPLYRISFCYTYGNTNPSDNVYGDLVFARPPWLRDEFPNGRQMPPSNLDGTLTDLVGNTTTLHAGGGLFG